MRVVRSLAELSAARDDLEQERRRVAFVPTMGALHAGHLSLIRLALRRADAVVVSIFVNPLQFGPGEDYARYPRPIETDLETCAQAGVDLVFVPSVSDLYPAGRQVSVSAGALGTVWEGRSRPGHFDGVLTVVLKLFHLVRPHVAVFGQKDAQQVACVRRMATDLNLRGELVAAPIVREPDGLALSSRNRFLSPPERGSALALSAALRAACAQSTPEGALQAARQVLAAEPSLELDYAALVHPLTFAEVPPDFTGEALLVVAAVVGSTRLIDNQPLRFARRTRSGPTPA